MKKLYPSVRSLSKFRRNAFTAAIILSIAFGTTFPVVTTAAELMPDFGGVPTGWVVDRYAPNSFSNVGTFQGRNNVLGIEINSAQGLTSRPSGYQSSFYNTQGMQYALDRRCRVDNLCGSVDSRQLGNCAWICAWICQN